ncbi:MAG: hypothetical protein DK306_000467 [Chloroflexi bacterium]|jgi:hypothetical protein|nr:MAG: hypothetical protein DK306_000467 [Chloroflexota bacterium]
MTDDDPASSTREIPGGYAPRGAGAAAVPVARYLTLAAARAIECNGCGDCCASGRTDGFWTWGQLPESQYRALNQGAPLIIPVERSDGSWRDRAWTADDANELGPTRFRCAAFAPRSDSGGACGLHDKTRPTKCGDFPVASGDLDRLLAAEGEAWLQTDAFPRCSWYRICVVPENDARLTPA